MNRYTLLVLTNPKPGQDAEFNRWYDQRHLPDVLATPGFVSAQRFALGGDPSSLQWRYMALYEFEAASPEQGLQDLQQRIGSDLMPMSEAMDMSAIVAAPFAAITSRKTRDGV